MLGSKYVANVIGMRTRTRTSYYVLLWDEVCMEPKIDIPKSSVVLLARTLGQAGRDRRGTTCTCPRGEHHPQGDETEGQYPYRAEHVLLARAVWPNAHEACTRHVKTGICSQKSCKKKFLKRSSVFKAWSTQNLDSETGQVPGCTSTALRWLHAVALWLSMPPRCRQRVQQPEKEWIDQWPSL